MQLEAGARLGPYEVLAPLGAGGMGEVYRARDLRLGRIVALKILATELAADAARRERFEREAHALSSLNHPHIAALYDVGEQDGLRFLVMEHVEGETLARRLLHGPVPAKSLVAWAAQIADALAAAHRAGIVHRDLKPSNIVLTKSGVKLIDFGVARLLRDAEEEGSAHAATEGATETLTGQGELVGTFGYMAPEQLEGRPIDARTDLFALGIVLFEMATGRRPFEARSQAGIVAAVLSAEPPALSTLNPTLPRALGPVLRRCLEKDPEDRWQSAADLGANLRWIDEAMRRSTTATVVRRRGWLVPAAAGLAVGVLAALLISRVERRGPDSPRGELEAPAIRYEIRPPDGVTFSQSGNPMALSPDGTKLAFVAGREGEPERLWIRSLDATRAAELAGTERASQPFWSADSRTLGFVTGRLAGGGSAAVKAIDLSASGATPRILARESGVGGAWSANGLLLLSGRGGILQRIATAAGTPEFVPPPHRSEPEFHLWPAFLPDGRRILYTVLSAHAERFGLHVAPLDGSGSRRLVEAASNGDFARPGYLLFGQRATLMAQPVDETTLALTGAPVPVAETVAYNLATHRHTFSVSRAGVLAYREEPQTELVWYDRDGAPIGSPLPPGHYRDPEISPDGTALAFSRLDPSAGSADIWTHDFRRGLSARATFDPGWEYAPVWSAVDALVYVERAADRYAFQLRRLAIGATASASESIFEQGAPFDASDWLRVENGVLWSPRSAAAGLRWTPVDGPRETVSLSAPGFRESQGRVSPNGKWLAYVSDETGALEVYLRESATGGKTKVSLDGGIEPRWRGDGRELFYVARDRLLMSVRMDLGPGGEMVPARPAALFRTRMSGSILGTLGRNQYDVAPDGRRFVVNQIVAEPPLTVVVNWDASLSRQAR